MLNSILSNTETQGYGWLKYDGINNLTSKVVIWLKYHGINNLTRWRHVILAYFSGSSTEHPLKANPETIETTIHQV